MKIINFVKKSFKPRLKLLNGTRIVSFLFIGTSILIAAGVLWAANVYYNIDTAEVVMEEIQRVTGVLRATAGVIVGGTASQNPTAGYGFEVVGQTRLATTTFATGTVELTAADQVLKFSGGTAYSVGFKAATGLATTTVYTWPTIYATTTGYVLQSTNTGVLSWLDLGGAGLGDITSVGDVGVGAAFTGSDTGNNLWFEGSTVDTNEILLTAVNPGADYTITLPAATGYIALGSSTVNYVAYWSSTSTLAGEQFLATSRGGIGFNSSAWSGMVKVVGGTWGTTTGTTSWAAYWSDANTVTAEQYLGVTRGGTGVGTFTSYGVLYGQGAGVIGVTAAGTADYLLVGAGGAAAPAWKTISQLLIAGTNISLSGSTSTTISTVNNPVFSASTTSPIFTSTATTTIQAANGIVLDPTNGRIVLGSGDWIETNLGFQIGKPGTQELREMIPIFGFDLPAQTATTSYVKISRTIQSYPFATTATGTIRIHKFAIRYTDNLALASSTDWRVATSGGAYTPFALAGCNNAALDSGRATTTGTVVIPTDATTNWWLEVKSQTPYASNIIRIFQIFLAAYDQIQ